MMLRRAGYEDVTVFERGERVGGVWHHNTYPGAACDVPSHLYEFSFAPEPALVAPLRAAGRDPGLPRGRRAAPRGARPDPHRRPRCSSARWDERARQVGAARRAPARTRPTSCSPPAASSRCRRCRRSRASTASRARPSTPRAWRHDVDLAGKRVAVVGTGCSAIQVVPAIQPIVEHVDVYQRSPGWTIPKMDFAYSRARAAAVRALPGRCSASTAPSIFAFMELGRRGDDAASAGCCRPFRARRAPADHHGDRRPRAARAR